MYDRLMRLMMVVTIFVSCSLFTFSNRDARAQEKIGVLFLGTGLSEEYSFDWRFGFFDHVYPSFPFGFLAGGPKEGGTCYTVIHYANEAEAFICGVAEGTPIDVFCNEYTGTYEVHSLSDHWPGIGDGTFFDDCYPKILPAAVFTGAHSTIDPVTLEVIEGPHIDDPAGTGIGIGDFLEISGFSGMDLSYRLPNNIKPTTIQDLKWFYGNDTPSFLGYAPDTPELTNIKDELLAAVPGTTFVFRHGSESFMKNLDVYGNPTVTPIPDSTETAIHELIHDENVDRIVVIHGAPDDSNLTRTGPCWRDENGQGVSSLSNKTYRECLEDVTDGKGPATEAELDLYYSEKPWEELFKSPNPEIEHLVREADPAMDVTFARPLNQLEGFELSVLEMVNHTISKHSIPDTASLRVIVEEHGLSAGWRNVLECDNYFNQIADITSRLITRIESSVSRTGTLEAVGGGNEFLEAGNDPVSELKPFGDLWSAGERIDEAINGTYVNELGQVIDNGTGNFDYIIVIPISWDSDSSDTLDNGRGLVLGNNILTSIDGQSAYGRDEHDADGTPYDAGDFDSEYFTVKVYDGTGWPSVPGCLEDPNCVINNTPVNKGAPAPNATTVILTGTILAIGNSTSRTHLTDAAVDSIVEAINNPDIGGYPDLKCEVDCEGNFDCDVDVDGTDAATFKQDFGRSIFSTPCINGEPCNGDFDCDVDVDGTDAAKFKEDFGRSQFNSPCSSCLEGPWCVYP